MLYIQLVPSLLSNLERAFSFGDCRWSHLPNESAIMHISYLLNLFKFHMKCMT